MRWRIEMSCYTYDIKYRPGTENLTADALSRICSLSSKEKQSLSELHDALCHPGITRFYHFVKSQNLSLTLDEVRSTVREWGTCAKLKPQFFKPPKTPLIKATQAFERLSLDFKGPLPTDSKNRYILTVVDQFSRFPFAIPCEDISSKTVISCLIQIFSSFGMPSCVHSDRGQSFMCHELRNVFIEKSVASSRLTPYNPEGNGQCERYNGSICKSVFLALKSRSLPIEKWEVVLPDALHSIRSLLSTATNMTPHERVFYFTRRLASGQGLPSWLVNSEKALLKRHVRKSKYEPLVDEVKLVDVNTTYARVRHADGREDTVSTKHLAPLRDGYPMMESLKETSKSPDQIDLEPLSDSLLGVQMPGEQLLTKDSVEETNNNREVTDTSNKISRESPHTSSVRGRSKTLQRIPTEKVQSFEKATRQIWRMGMGVIFFYVCDVAGDA